MIKVIQVEVGGISERFEIMFDCTGSLSHFGDVDLEIEQATDAVGKDRTEEFMEHFLTPEIEEALVKTFWENYEPNGD